MGPSPQVPEEFEPTIGRLILTMNKIANDGSWPHRTPKSAVDSIWSFDSSKFPLNPWGLAWVTLKMTELLKATRGHRMALLVAVRALKRFDEPSVWAELRSWSYTQSDLENFAESLKAAARRNYLRSRRNGTLNIWPFRDTVFHLQNQQAHLTTDEPNEGRRGDQPPSYHDAMAAPTSTKRPQRSTLV